MRPSLHGLRLIGLLALFAGTGSALAQQPEHQVQALLEGVRSPQHAHHVDLLLLELDGVLMSRTDVHHGDLLLLVRADSPVDEGAVAEVLARTGVRMRCWTRRPREDAPFKRLDPRECAATPEAR